MIVAILDYSGEWHFMSDEVYIVTKDKPIAGEGYQKGDKVRLIDGVDGSVVPGYHFSDGYVTVCSVNVTVAEFVGLRRDTLELDEGER